MREENFSTLCHITQTLMNNFRNMNKGLQPHLVKAIPEMFVRKKGADKNPVGNYRDLSEGERAREIEIESRR